MPAFLSRFRDQLTRWLESLPLGKALIWLFRSFWSALTWMGRASATDLYRRPIDHRLRVHPALRWFRRRRKEGGIERLNQRSRRLFSSRLMCLRKRLRFSPQI